MPRSLSQDRGLFYSKEKNRLLYQKTVPEQSYFSSFSSSNSERKAAVSPSAV